LSVDDSHPPNPPFTTAITLLFSNVPGGVQ
jgi:hypothetical protein